MRARTTDTSPSCTAATCSTSSRSAPQLRALFPSRSAFVQRNGVGPVSLTALRRELAAVRAAGHAQEDGSVTPGFASVAVAVLDHAGHPAASVALTFPAAEVDDQGRAELAARVARAAAQVAQRIRGRPLS